MTTAAKVLRQGWECLDLTQLSGDVRMRSAAMLARQALEHALHDALESDGVDPSRMSFRTQLECLRHLRDLGGLARDAAYVWAALSRVTHYHGYELPPTREALVGWMETASAVVEALGNGRGETGTGERHHEPPS